jgi:hypothetical protein
LQSRWTDIDREAPVKRYFGFVLAMLLAAGSVWPQEIFDLFRKGDVPAVRAMIEKSPQLVDARDGDGARPPLRRFQRDPSRPVLIDKGAKIEAVDAKSRRLSISPSRTTGGGRRCPPRTRAAVEGRDDYQRTPSSSAPEQGSALGRLLIEAGADVNAKDKFGSDALELAAWRGKADFVDLLLEKGARVPESGERWQMAVSQAASQGLSKLFRRLTDGRDEASVLAASRSILHDAAAGGSAGDRRHPPR